MLTACAHCHRRFVVSSDAVGKAARCSHCGERFLIAPREPNRIGLLSDDDDLARSLHLPTLDEIEEAMPAPDIGKAPGDAPPIGRFVPGAAGPNVVAYVEGQRTTASILLLLWLAVVVAYGCWASGYVPAALAEARSQGLSIAMDAWARVWRPMLVGSVTILVIAGGLFWAGASVAARLLRVKYSTYGALESIAIAAVPIALPMIFAMCVGSDSVNTRMTGLALSLPVVCLLVPTLFGVPMAKGLTAATICIAFASPGYLVASLWARDFTQQQVVRDDQRIARAISRFKEARAEQPENPTAATMPAAISPIAQEARQLSEQMLPPAMPGVPQVPPAVAAELDNQAATRASAAIPAPASFTPGTVRTAVPASATVPLAGSPVPYETRLPLRPIRALGTPDAIVWPTVRGSVFACIRADGYGNHIVEIWSQTPIQRLGELHLGGGNETSYGVSPDGEAILRVVNGVSPFAELWSVADGARRWQVPLASNQLGARVLGYFDAQTAGILWHNGNDAMLDVIDLRRGATKRTISWVTLNGTQELTCETVAMTPDGKAVAVLDAGSRLKVMDIVTGSIRKQWTLNLPKDHIAELTQITFSPDGALVAVLIDENPNSGRCAFFWGYVGDSDLSVVNLSEPLWRQAGCTRPTGRRVGHVLDWLNPGSVLLYGELVMAARSGVITASVHPREATRPPGPAACSQHRLPDDSFVLEYLPDASGKRQPIQRLPADALPHQ